MSDLLYCKTCGVVGTGRKQTPGSFAIEVVLWLCFLVPGIIYTLWRLSSKRRVCASCGSRELIPATSPAATASLAAIGRTGAVEEARTVQTADRSDAKTGWAAIAGVGAIVVVAVQPVLVVLSVPVIWWSVATLLPGTRLRRVLLGALAGFIGSGLAIAAGSAITSGSGETAREVAARTNSYVPNGRPITAKQLFEDYHTNEVAADQEHKGKLLEVTGAVVSINKDVVDSSYLILQGGENQFMGVRADFGRQPRQQEALSQLRSGQTVTIQCTGGGMLIGSPILRNCVLAE